MSLDEPQPLQWRRCTQFSSSAPACVVAVRCRRLVACMRVCEFWLGCLEASEGSGRAGVRSDEAVRCFQYVSKLAPNPALPGARSPIC